MKTLSHIPQQPDIPDEFIGCVDGALPESHKWVGAREPDGWIFRSTEGSQAGLCGWHKRKDGLVNLAIKYGYTVLSFDSQAELDAWLKQEATKRQQQSA